MATPSTSHQQVHLFDWWLIKAEDDLDGKRLSIGGFTYDEKKGTRMFSSAPIVKKLDMLTLETADGITVCVTGTINETRSNENGISSEVCDHFLLGFPYNWEDSRYHFGGLISTSESFLSNERGMLKGSAPKGISLKENLEDASRDSLLQVNAEFSGRYVELHTTEDNATENGALGEDIVSNLSNGIPSEINMVLPVETSSGGHLSRGDSSKAHRTSHGKMDKKNESVGTFGIRRSNRVINLKGTNNRKKVQKTKATPVSRGSDFKNGDAMDCGSGGKVVEDGQCIGHHEQMNCTSDSNLLDNAGNFILKSSNDGLQVRVTSLNCNGDVTRDDASVYTSKKSVSVTPKIYLKSMSKNDTVDNSSGQELPSCSSKKVTSPRKKDSRKKPMRPVEARRSNRLKVVNNGTDNRQETEKNKIVSVSPDLARNIGEEMTCESVGKNIWESPIAPRETLHNSSLNVNSERSDHGLTRGSLSKSKTKRRLEYITDVSSTPITKSKRKKLSFLSPDESGCKKSKSGRLISPPLDYWRNQKVFYEKDGKIAGVLNGLPMAELCSGSKSEVLTKRKNFI